METWIFNALAGLAISCFFQLCWQMTAATGHLAAIRKTLQGRAFNGASAETIAVAQQVADTNELLRQCVSLLQDIERRQERMERDAGASLALPSSPSAPPAATEAIRLLGDISMNVQFAREQLDAVAGEIFRIANPPDDNY